jgi:hypothetical protein
MEEQEVNLEDVHGIVQEHASKVSWAEKVALTTALLAVCAAVTSLLSTHESDRAILFKVDASDRWSYYQAKGIKGMLTQDPANQARYRSEQDEIQKEAEALDRNSEIATHAHEFFAYSVTLFQVATALGAIAVLTKKKYMWVTSMALGVLGVALVARAISVLL